MATGGYALLDATTGLVPSSSLPSDIPKLATIVDVDLKTVAQTTLYTVPAFSSGCVITDVILMISASDTATVGATLNVGMTPSWNEWIGSTALTTLTSLYETQSLNNTATGRTPMAFGPDDVIKLDITVGATATSLRATVVVLGFNL